MWKENSTLFSEPFPKAAPPVVPLPHGAVVVNVDLPLVVFHAAALHHLPCTENVTGNWTFTQGCTPSDPASDMQMLASLSQTLLIISGSDTKTCFSATV